MKTPLPLALFTCFILPLAAFARLGETEAEIATRYGKSTGGAPADIVAAYSPAAPVRTYEKAGLRIYVAFLDGRSVAEVYGRLDGAAIADADRAPLLEANRSGSAWYPDPDKPNLWERDDLKAVARYLPNRHLLDVLDVRLTERDRAERRKELNGF